MKPLDVTLRVGSALFGLMWLVAAASKAAEPESAYEFVALVVGGGPSAKTLITVAAAAEALLGAAMLLGAVGGTVRGMVATGAGLAITTGALVWVKVHAGGARHCGCMALLADSSVDQAIARNAWLMGGAIALGAVAIVIRRRDRDAAAASGPSTDAR
ncbi:MAG: hypothetical protein K8T90_06190 [Planctomycetes bacterium]|nr:hypothetical protein [Planctomycetota bacterium]